MLAPPPQLQAPRTRLHFSHPTRCRLRAQPLRSASVLAADKSGQQEQDKRSQQQQEEQEDFWALPGKERRGGLSKRAFRRARDAAKEPEDFLLKILARAGVASRRKAEALIREGHVKVGRLLVTKPEFLARATDEITVDGQPLPRPAPPVYYAVNKPKGYLCASSRTRGEEQRKLVVDLLQDHWKKEGGQRKRQGGPPPPRLFTVGRLDVASTGLIFVTNDGVWGQKVQHPSGNLTKEYLVTTSEAPSMAQLEVIAGGCEVDGGFVAPVTIAPEGRAPHRGRHWLRVVVAEGRNREVRTLVANAGLDVVALKRVRIGGYTLPGDLGIGQVRALKASDVHRTLDLGVQRDSTKVIPLNN